MGDADANDTIKVAADPQAPVTRKGFLISIKTGEPTEIKERDVVYIHKL